MATRKSPRLAAQAKVQNNDTVEPADLHLGAAADTGKSSRKPNLMKLYLRGCASNGIGSLILFAVGKGLGLESYVLLAAGIQAAVFVFHGLPFSSEKFYDISGSVTHFSVVAYSLCAEPRVRSARQVLVALMSVVWMVRLGTFLFGRIHKDGKDDRFDAIKQCWLSFLGAWTLQACWVTLVQLPVIMLNNRDDAAPLGPIDAMAFIAWVFGFLFEFQADVEKSTFRSDPKNKQKFITSGVWSLSRHPNYFGEILMWCAVALCVSFVGQQLQDPRLYWSWASPGFTAVLLLKVSGVPMVEKAGQKKWGKDPAYQKYVADTPCVVPRLF